jgi:hypothetical protein
LNFSAEFFVPERLILPPEEADIPEAALELLELLRLIDLDSSSAKKIKGLIS